MKAALLSRLVAGDVPYILVGCDEPPERPILLPGSFNPLHMGHEGLLRAAEKASERNCIFELSVSNVDKPPLDIDEVERRISQLNGRYCAVLTCAPTFAEKAELFPDAWFAMGYDTVVRLVSPAYHKDVPAMLGRFRELGTRFVVAGRLHENNYQGLESVQVPAGFEDLFIPIPEELFREDISSTELRKQK